MKNIKKSVAVILVVICLASLSGCLKYTSNILEVTTASSGVYDTSAYYEPSNTTPYTEPTSSPEITSGQDVTSATEPSSTSVTPTQPQATEAPVTEAPASQSSTDTNPAQWTKEQTLKFLADAMNKSRAVTTPVTVHHTENFSFSVSEVTGGNTVKDIANSVIGGIAKPSDETLNFNGGTAVNGEGETVKLLLPKTGNFSLDAAGCTSVSASKSGTDTVIKVTLIKESVGMNDVPKYNASACGYLDVASIDIPMIKITAFNIDYQQTTITYVINSNGYVSKASYHVPLALDAQGKLGLTVTVKASGYEDEVWEVKW